MENATLVKPRVVCPSKDPCCEIYRPLRRLPWGNIQKHLGQPPQATWTRTARPGTDAGNRVTSVHCSPSTEHKRLEYLALKLSKTNPSGTLKKFLQLITKTQLQWEHDDILDPKSKSFE